jgi:hypothetical protein
MPLRAEPESYFQTPYPIRVQEPTSTEFPSIYYVYHNDPLPIILTLIAFFGFLAFLAFLFRGASK